MATCMATCSNFSYMALNLVGEVGEFASKVAKSIRKEAGDILWQLSGLCKVMGWSLEDVAQENLDKLASRQARGVIDGNGDNR